MRGEGDNVRERNRARDRLTCHQSDEVCGIDHHDRADFIGDFPECGEVDQPRVGRCPTDDHLRPVLTCEIANLVVVDEFGVLANTVGHHVEPLAGEVHRRAMGEMSAVRQAHRENGVSRRRKCPVGGDVRAGTAVRLQVCVFSSEECLGTLDTDLFGRIDLRAPAVITTTWIPLGVLVAERASQGREHRGRGEVLACDQLKSGAEPLEFTEDDLGDLRILRLEGTEIRPPEDVLIL